MLHVSTSWARKNQKPQSGLGKLTLFRGCAPLFCCCFIAVICCSWLWRLANRMQIGHKVAGIVDLVAHWLNAFQRFLLVHFKLNRVWIVSTAFNCWMSIHLISTCVCVFNWTRWTDKRFTRCAHAWPLIEWIFFNCLIFFNLIELLTFKSISTFLFEAFSTATNSWIPTTSSFCSS